MAQTSQRPLSNMELSSFCEQIALILKSGISSLEGITIMSEEAREGEEKTLLLQILEQLNETGSLCESLRSTGVYPDYMLQMVQIGEETGTLDEVMESLSCHYEREENISRTIKSAITYPLIMAGMMLIVILVLLVEVMPIFNQVYVQLGTEMTGFSRVLMNIGSAINRYSVVLVVIVALLALFALYATRTEKGRAMSRGLAYRFNFTRKIFEEIAASRFASGMALTLSSGLDPDHSMELVTALNDDPDFAKKLDSCKEKMSEGTDLSDALYETEIFGGVYARMASIGSKTGSMEQVMDRIADLYQDDIDTRMNNILAALEPTMVIVLSLIVGVILLSVMLPLMGIISSI